MTTKKFLSIGCAVLAAICLHPLGLLAQASPPAAQNEEPLQMIIDYGDGTQKHRESHHGIMEPVGLPLGQMADITLTFLRKHAGEPVGVTQLDGGELFVPVEDGTLAADGTYTFSFRASGTTGLYRVLVSGVEQYELRFYVFDPNHSPTRPSGTR